MFIRDFVFVNGFYLLLQRSGQPGAGDFVQEFPEQAVGEMVPVQGNFFTVASDRRRHAVKKTLATGVGDDLLKIGRPRVFVVKIAFQERPYQRLRVAEYMFS